MYSADPFPPGPSWGQIILERLLTATLDQTKSAPCSIPSFGGSFAARGYHGLGGGPVVDLGFDPGSGRNTALAGLDVGLGAGGAAEWNWRGSGTAGRTALDGWGGSLGGNINVTLGPVAFGGSQTFVGPDGAGFGGISGASRAGAGLSGNVNIGARGGYRGRVGPRC